MSRIEYLIETLKLKPHPEGGYYRRTYRSDSEFDFKQGRRYLQTAIYYLLIGEEISEFHRLKSDEIWLWHEGSSVKIHFRKEDGAINTSLLGIDFANNEQAQIVIPADTWFSAENVDKTNYALISCIVSPGFDFEDFELLNS